MKRLIEFKYHNDTYYLEEKGTSVFSINVSDLKFNSLNFYEGIYKGKSPNIELVNKLESDPHKKGTYIFSWLSDIISGISNEFPDIQSNDENDTAPIRLIPLFEFTDCAEDNFIINELIPHTDIQVQASEANFAVNISGDCMEPTIRDKSIIYVKSVEDLNHNDIGLFIANGAVMCKRYIKRGRGFILVSDNSNYDPISRKDLDSFKILGKVLI